jgi:hypothetical protein
MPVTFLKDKSMKTEQIPSTALCFVDHSTRAEVFAEGEDKKPKLKMIAYSGKIIHDHFWWGDLALDVSGMKLSKSRLPILSDHDTDKKVGFADKVLTEGNQIVIDPESMSFVDTDDANEFIKLSKEGFPFESSVRMSPIKIQRLVEKETAEVNGFTMKGPGTIVREWQLKEASVCVFGYDSHTNSKAFSEKVDLTYTDVSVDVTNFNTKEVKQMDKETFMKENPELFAEMQKEVKDSVTAELTATFSKERETLKTEITSLKDEKKAVDTRVLELEKRDELRTIRENKLEAERIWGNELSESKIPEKFYSRLKKYVPVDTFVENMVLDVVKFTEAVKKEIKEWEDDGVNKDVMGLGSGQRREDESVTVTETKKENETLSNSLLELAGQKTTK